MAAKKTASKNTPKKNARGRGGDTAKKSPKTRFYATPNRVFTAAGLGELPKGTFVRLDSAAPGGLDTTVRIGTKRACVYEGSLRDLLTAALGKQRLKVKVDGELIPSPATPPAAPAL